MNAAVILGAAIAAAAIVQFLLLGRGVYHSGWYNALVAALVVLLLLCVRPVLRKLSSTRAKVSAGIAFAGITAIGFATVTSGLLAPDPHVVTGAPGQQVRVDDLGGSLAFPLAAKDGSLAGDVMLLRPGRGALAIGNGRNVGTFVLVTQPRRVVYVEADDLSGAHLTVTQPTGTAFLSPVLLMQQQQTIGEMNVPFDSFSVPAAHRIVKAVLFAPDQAARLHDFAGSPLTWAVLFAADDAADQPIPHAIALAPEGERVTLAGMRLRARVLSYPALEVIAVPSVPAVLLGLGAAIAGLLIAASLTRRPGTV